MELKSSTQKEREQKSYIQKHVDNVQIMDFAI